MELRHLYKNKVASSIAAIGALGGFAALMYGLVQQVRSGKGLDHYTAMSGYEWSPLVVLIFITIAFAVLAVGGLLNWIAESHEERSFIRTLRRRMARHGARVSEAKRPKVP